MEDQEEEYVVVDSIAGPLSFKKDHKTPKKKNRQERRAEASSKKGPAQNVRKPVGRSHKIGMVITD